MRCVLPTMVAFHAVTAVDALCLDVPIFQSIQIQRAHVHVTLHTFTVQMPQCPPPASRLSAVCLPGYHGVGCEQCGVNTYGSGEIEKPASNQCSGCPASGTSPAGSDAITDCGEFFHSCMPFHHSNAQLRHHHQFQQYRV
jgi:hypothetical protein